jgi:hypothetical protein
VPSARSTISVLAEGWYTRTVGQNATSHRGNYRGNLRIGLKDHDEIDIVGQETLCVFKRDIETRLTIEGNEIYPRSFALSVRPRNTARWKDVSSVSANIDLVPSARRHPGEPVFQAPVFHDHTVRLKCGHESEDG